MHDPTRAPVFVFSLMSHLKYFFKKIKKNQKKFKKFKKFKFWKIFWKKIFFAEFKNFEKKIRGKLRKTLPFFSRDFRKKKSAENLKNFTIF